AHLFGGLLARAFPRVAAERMQWCEFRRGAGVAADQPQLRHRHVELVALGVFDGEELAIHAAHVHREQALVAAHAVINVHDRRAEGELGEIADDRFRIARGAAATLAVALAAHPLAVQLALSEHGERGFGEREALFQAGDGDGELYLLVATYLLVILAQAGIQRLQRRRHWIPAFAGMTGEKSWPTLDVLR